MNLRIFLWSLTAALAGFLFGFDILEALQKQLAMGSLDRGSDEFRGAKPADDCILLTLMLPL